MSIPKTRPKRPVLHARRKQSRSAYTSFQRNVNEKYTSIVRARGKTYFLAELLYVFALRRQSAILTIRIRVKGDNRYFIGCVRQGRMQFIWETMRNDKRVRRLLFTRNATVFGIKRSRNYRPPVQDKWQFGRVVRGDSTFERH